MIDLDKLSAFCEEITPCVVQAVRVEAPCFLGVWRRLAISLGIFVAVMLVVGVILLCLNLIIKSKR